MRRLALNRKSGYLSADQRLNFALPHRRKFALTAESICTNDRRRFRRADDDSISRAAYEYLNAAFPSAYFNPRILTGGDVTNDEIFRVH